MVGGAGLWRLQQGRDVDPEDRSDPVEVAKLGGWLASAAASSAPAVIDLDLREGRRGDLPKREPPGEGQGLDIGADPHPEVDRGAGRMDTTGP